MCPKDMRSKVYVCRGFRCDINCDNLLGLRNTKLLACYGRMDPRFLQLG